MSKIDLYKLSIAPMVGYSDRHFRYLMRLLTPHALVYTEMLSTGAILRGDRGRFLAFDEAEHPVAVQLGGNDPKQLAECAKIVEDYGYDAVNLNVGCPSPRVAGSGSFGAALMSNPTLIAECFSAMQAAVKIPVTIKTRLGIGKVLSYENLLRIVQPSMEAGCKTFILHARNVWPNLSPKENREKPPISYEIVYRFKEEYPDLDVVINGEVFNVAQTLHHLDCVDGVMLGRLAYENPYELTRIDAAVYPSNLPIKTPKEIVEAYLPYIESQLKQGIPLHRMTRHLLNLFHGLPGAKQWRRDLSFLARHPGKRKAFIRDLPRDY